jgi:signal peptidase I
MANSESYQEHKEKRYFLKILEGKLLFIVGIPLIALLITAFVFHFYRVDGSSMERTFQHNDLLIVEKLGRTSASIFNRNYAPKRNDIVVFKEPSYSDDRELVKRVVGIPGDRVVINNGKVTVHVPKTQTGFRIDEDILPPPESKIIGETNTVGKADVKVKKGELFVLGDNRPNSDDSRVFGPVQTKNIVGKVIVRILPFKSLLIL